MKVVLLGPRRLVTGFLLGGIHEGFVCEQPEESGKTFERCLEQPDIGMILVSRSVADMIPEMIHQAKRSSRIVPLVSVIPDNARKLAVCEEDMGINKE